MLHLLHSASYLIWVNKMSWPDEKQQGKRVLLAMITIMTVVPIVGAILLLLGGLLLEYTWGGSEAVIRMVTDWSEPSPYAQDIGFKIGFVLVGCFAMGIPVSIWYRFFIKTGYLTKHTLDSVDQGQLPGISKYLVPFMRLLLGGFFVSGAYDSFQQGAHILMVFLGAGGIWFIYLSFQELIRWYRGKK